MDKESLAREIETLKSLHDEQLRAIRQEKYLLQAQVIQIPRLSPFHPENSGDATDPC